ncbi:hypothetical protein BDZ89DRAFT_1072721 [Hymenopellis radicata]|nr:hypothetical protein BDZ89DRAFT_1072721 [Hymenopellis radicata]
MTRIAMRTASPTTTAKTTMRTAGTTTRVATLLSAISNLFPPSIVHGFFQQRLGEQSRRWSSAFLRNVHIDCSTLAKTDSPAIRCVARFLWCLNTANVKPPAPSKSVKQTGA